jgi:hypothetical protein
LATTTTTTFSNPNERPSSMNISSQTKFGSSSMNMFGDVQDIQDIEQKIDNLKKKKIKLLQKKNLFFFFFLFFFVFPTLFFFFLGGGGHPPPAEISK